MKIDTGEFLKHAGSIPVVDVRSPSEYSCGHIPGAFNIPLFSDSERASVGTKYKNEGRRAAIVEGLKHAGPSLSLKMEEAVNVAKDGKLLVYCWRGGMRSETMAWLFSLAGIEILVLEGGYKAYRSHVLQSLSGKRKMIVLGGMTGSSKTYILKHLEFMGQQVIDLEGLANHKGSAFGSLGQMPQPSNEHFSNLLFDRWNGMERDLPFWVEDESRNIGTVFLPDTFFRNMQDTPAIILIMDLKVRITRLISEYSSYPPDLLKASIMKISKRLGGDNARNAVKSVEDGNFSRAVEITLDYYDKSYTYGLKKKSSGNIIRIETDTDDIQINARKVLEVAQEIAW
jgi:tRNA 2-selenouridine synthase